MNWREEVWEKLKAEADVSVLIIGGGINGAGLFRELALQGVDCLLVDKADFATGASSKSSRMIHGGLRYLENRELKLVAESLRERDRLLENAPHFVAPLKTTIPLFSYFGGLLRSALIFFGCKMQAGSRGTVPIELGLRFYDLVTRKNPKTPRHFLMGTNRSLRATPGLHPDIVGTATYWDAWITQAERLCIELLQDGLRANPRCRVVNYVELMQRGEGRGEEEWKMENGKWKMGEVWLRDEVTGESVVVRPKIVVNATGAWVDKTNALLGLSTRYMGPTKGSHLVVDNKELHRALDGRMVYYQYEDGRVCIVFPFMDKVIMGSTDIRVDDPETARCEEDEVEYMLKAVGSVFPGITLKREQIVFKFCGVRPLPRSGSDVTATVSRGHSVRIDEPDPGRSFPVFSLIGGKLTTFRAFAEQIADRILPRLNVQRKCGTERIPIGGGKDFPVTPGQKEAWIRRVAQKSGLAERRVGVLLERYGTGAEKYALEAAAGGEQALKSLPDYTAEEILWIVRNEFVVHLSDLVCRRSLIALLGDAREPVLRELADVVGVELGWDEKIKEMEIRIAKDQ